MDKFNLFRVVDLASFGGISLIPTGLTVYAAANGTTGAPLIMLIVTSLMFWAIFGIFVYFRKQFLNKINFISKHNLAIVANEFLVKKEDVETITTDTIQKWYSATGWSGCAKAIEGTWVFFQTYPVHHHTVVGGLAGYTIGDTIVIGYQEDLNNTALAHELGHIIHAAWTSSYNEEASHKYMKDHNLP